MRIISSLAKLRARERKAAVLHLASITSDRSEHHKTKDTPKTRKPLAASLADSWSLLTSHYSTHTHSLSLSLLSQHPHPLALGTRQSLVAKYQLAQQQEQMIHTFQSLFSLLFYSLARPLLPSDIKMALADTATVSQCQSHGLSSLCIIVSRNKWQANVSKHRASLLPERGSVSEWRVTSDRKFSTRSPILLPRHIRITRALGCGCVLRKMAHDAPFLLLSCWMRRTKARMP